MEFEEIKNPNKFLNLIQDFPLYKRETITTSDLSSFCVTERFIIEQYCEKCGTNRSFCTRPRTFCSEIIAELVKMTPTPGTIEHTKKTSELGLEKDCFVILPFECQHFCGERHSVTVRVSSEGFMEKIGQFPSFSKLQVEENLRRYRNIISKYYPELTKSVSLYSQGYGIASFVYLRRILEHLIDEKYNCLSNAKNTAKFVDKLNEVEKVEEIIPQDMVSIKGQIYSILSKGVHEYDEDECLSLYESVKFVIEDILDKQIANRERKKKITAATKAIQSKLGGTNNGR